MTASTGLLLLGSLSLLATLAAVFRFRRLGPMLVLYFFTAWLQAELAVFHIIWQSLLAIWLSSAGALEHAGGQMGLALLLCSFAGLAYILKLSAGAGEVYRTALSTGLGQDYRQAIQPEREQGLRDTVDWREWLRPFSFRREGVRVIKNLPYGPAGKRNLLDLYLPDALPEGELCPVLLHVHGGAWMISNKEQQALPLLNHLAQRGWVCVTVNYRLSPRATFPDHIVDVKQALAWIRHRIQEYGGNPEFVAITGGSAGGHLSSLAALTANEARYQPGFEYANTAVQAAVPIYGVYDWNDASGSGGVTALESLLEKHVIKAPRSPDSESWQRGTSLSNIHADAPPMLMIHGTHDSLVRVEDARHFVEQLKSVSRNPVLYAELPGAQHAFEIFHSLRSDFHVIAVTEFLEWAYGSWSSQVKDATHGADSQHPEPEPSEQTP